jgi:hypothetical protein
MKRGLFWLITILTAVIFFSCGTQNQLPTEYKDLKLGESFNTDKDNVQKAEDTDGKEKYIWFDADIKKGITPVQIQVENGIIVMISWQEIGSFDRNELKDKYKAYFIEENNIMIFEDDFVTYRIDPGRIPVMSSKLPPITHTVTLKLNSKAALN